MKASVTLAYWLGSDYDFIYSPKSLRDNSMGDVAVRSTYKKLCKTYEAHGVLRIEQVFLHNCWVGFHK